MSFPASFPSQVTAVLEALLKAVVLEVTALVEEGAVELRLEIRDRDREIREKERGIEQRDREIAQLRAAVEELRAREEAAVSPGREDSPEEETETCQQQEWTKEDDQISMVKSEPMEEFNPTEPDLDQSLWSPPPPSTSDTITDTTTATFSPNNENSSNSTHEKQSHNSEQTKDFSHFNQTDFSLNSPLNMNHQLFYSHLLSGFSPFNAGDASTTKRYPNKKRQTCGAFRCDQCEKVFTVKWRLVSHQSVHTGAKPFSCRKCGSCFSRRDSCMRHEKKSCCKDYTQLPQGT